jgi:hypothetical protein
LNFESSQSLFDLPASDSLNKNLNKKDGLIIETNIIKTPQADIVPRFLSEISVCKTLESLNKEENDDASIDLISQQTQHTDYSNNNNNNNNVNNNNIDDTFLAFNDTLLNDFFHTNAIIESDSHNYQSYEIQSDLFEQAEKLESQIMVQSAENNSSNGVSNIPNQLNLLSDQFIFEDQFLKDFEANLDKFESNDFTQNMNNGGKNKKYAS